MTQTEQEFPSSAWPELYHPISGELRVPVPLGSPEQSPLTAPAITAGKGQMAPEMEYSTALGGVREREMHFPRRQSQAFVP